MNQSAVSRKNSQFFDELCASGLAKSIRISMRKLLNRNLRKGHVVYLLTFSSVESAATALNPITLVASQELIV